MNTETKIALGTSAVVFPKRNLNLESKLKLGITFTSKCARRLVLCPILNLKQCRETVPPRDLSSSLKCRLGRNRTGGH